MLSKLEKCYIHHLKTFSAPMREVPAVVLLSLITKSSSSQLLVSAVNLKIVGWSAPFCPPEAEIYICPPHLSYQS